MNCDVVCDQLRANQYSRSIWDEQICATGCCIVLADLAVVDTA